MTAGLLFSAAIFSFVTSVTPGPNNTFLLSSGVNFGLKKSMPYLMGIMAGLCGMMLAIGLGLGVVFTTFPVVYQALKYIGFAYILHLAYLIVMSTNNSETAESQYIGFWKSTTFQFVNPKAWIVLASYMATFVPVESGIVEEVATCLVFLVATFPGALVWAISGQLLRNWLSEPKRRKIFNLTSAILLVLSMIPVLFLH
jgi:threonine/homoserine/homoserine lactone efflux protein